LASPSASWPGAATIAGQKEAPVTSKDVVLTAAGITDMQPVRDMASEIKNQTIELRRIGDELGTIRQILAEDAEERQDYRQWRTGFEAGSAKVRHHDAALAEN
jgi:flagellar biosynthesis chaperone FliJ